MYPKIMMGVFPDTSIISILAISACFGSADLQSNESFQRSFDAKLTQHGLPYYNQSKNTIVTSLKCQSRDIADCRSIKWMPVLSSRIGEMRVDTSNCKSILTLEVKLNTSKAALPKFQCVVERRGQNKRSRPLRPRLFIQILTKNSSVSAFMGDNILLHCPIKNDLPESAKATMRVHWGWLNPSQSKVISLHVTQSLTLPIRKVNKSQEGWFQCWPIGAPEYNVRAPRNSSWIKLKVIDVPDAPQNVRFEVRGVCGVIVWDRPNASFGEIEAVELNCSIEAVSLHSPSVSNIKINSSSNGRRCRILFRSSVRASDYSKYVTIPACEQPGKFHCPKFMIGGAICLLVVFLLKKFHILVFRHKRRSISLEVKERQHESPSKAKDTLASDVKEIKSVVKEILESALTDNAVNLARNAVPNKRKAENQSTVEASGTLQINIGELDDGVVNGEGGRESPV